MKIGLITRSVNNACAYYRTTGPLCSMQKTIPDFSFKIISDINWFVCRELDLIIIQRPLTEQELNAIKLCKMNGLRTIIDWDDDAINVPLGNPAYYAYQTNKKYVEDSLRIADLIIVSTLTMKELYLPYNKNVEVIHNHFDDDKLQMLATYPKLRKKTVLWRGGVSHREDVDTYSDAIKKVIETNKDWQFVFLGDVFPKLALENVTFIGEMDITRFFGFIKELEPAICIVPLADNAFNRSKSNIAWIETTYAGAITLAPEMPEWIKLGITNFKDSKDFGFKLTKLMSNTSSWEGLWTASYGYINSNLLLSNLNAKRYHIFQKVIQGGYNV